ncbi:hypothetical protein D3C78_1799370 [compost metagenome]
MTRVQRDLGRSAIHDLYRSHPEIPQSPGSQSLDRDLFGRQQRIELGGFAQRYPAHTGQWGHGTQGRIQVLRRIAGEHHRYRSCNRC